MPGELPSVTSGRWDIDILQTSSHQMLVSWNRGTPSHHPCSWDFLYKPTIFGGVWYLWHLWKPANEHEPAKQIRRYLILDFSIPFTIFVTFTGFQGCKTPLFDSPTNRSQPTGAQTCDVEESHRREARNVGPFCGILFLKGLALGRWAFQIGRLVMTKSFPATIHNEPTANPWVIRIFWHVVNLSFGFVCK